MSVCIIDTSIVVELLGLPGFSDHHEMHLATFAERAMAKETFLLPLPVLFETGNHVAQIPDGRLRREWADRFVTFAKQALLGETPFVPTPFPAMQDVASWLEDFADHAMRQVGLVDRSLIDLFERQRALLKGTRHVYIWALDQALIGFDTRIHGSRR